MLYQFLPHIHVQDSKQLKYPPLFFLIEKVPKSLAVKLAFTRLILPRPGKILAGIQVGEGEGEFRGSSSSSWRRKQKLEASLGQHCPSPTLTLSSMARSSRHIHGANSLGDDLLFSYSTGNFSLSQHTATQCCSYSHQAPKFHHTYLPSSSFPLLKQCFCSISVSQGLRIPVLTRTVSERGRQDHPPQVQGFTEKTHRILLLFCPLIG